MRKRFSVYIADDHPLIREGLARAVGHRAELDLVGEAADGRTALDDISELRPDVALVDVSMPELDGLEVLNAIARNGVPTAVVLLSAQVTPDVVYRAFGLGAVGFVSKEAGRDEICDVLVAAGRGETRLSPDVQTELVRQVHRHARDAGPKLSEREQEVLGLIAEGLSVREIGERLTLSPATIKTHLQTLYEKLEVSDRAAAVATAMRAGLLE
jgi:two-component system, NarL family, nitrate/nitrite response regulator NarL